MIVSGYAHPVLPNCPHLVQRFHSAAEHRTRHCFCLMSDLVANIAVNVGVNKTFHYLVPDELKEQLVPGSRVLVPFGSRRIPGTVIDFADKT